MELQEKIEKNTWDNVQDFIKVLQLMREGNWWWYKNSRCKYVNLRVDMRDGGCIIMDRNGARIDPKELAFQHQAQNEPSAPPPRKTAP